MRWPPPDNTNAPRDTQPMTGGGAAGPRRRAIVVTGMHRSGTSAITGLLSILGAAAPRNVIGANEENETGFWEPEPIVRVHDEVLASVGSAWDDPALLPAEWFRSEAAKRFEMQLAELIDQEFGDAPLFALKDPRICRLVPLWLATLERVDADPCFVLPVRNPLEVVASLAKRNDFGSEKSLVLWLAHLLDAERDTRGRPRVILSYDRLLSDWHGVVDRLSRELGLSFPHPPDEARAEVERFLLPRLRHHTAPEDVEAQTEAVEWVSPAYRAVLAAAAGEEGALGELERIRADVEAARRAFAPVIAETRRAPEDRVAEAARRATAANQRATAANREATAATKRAEQAEERARTLARRADELAVRARDGERLEAEVSRARAGKPPREGPLEKALRREADRRRRSSARERLQGVAKLASWAVIPTPRRLRLIRTYLAISRSGRFDAAFYRDSYPDVAASGAHPLADYVERGWRAGRDPTETFGTRAYLESRPDVAKAGINPLLHHILHGGDPDGAVHVSGGPEAAAGSSGVAGPATADASEGATSQAALAPKSERPRARPKISVLCWDMGHNPLGRAHLLADALSRSFDVEIIGAQFPRYGDEIWAPLRDTTISMRTFPGSDFPEHFVRMERLAREITGDVILACKPRLPSYELGILAKEAINRPLVLDVDDRELSFFSESSGMSLSEVDAKRDDPDFRVPFERIWTRHCDTLVGCADAVIVSNEQLAKLYGGTVIPHGRDERVFDPALYDRAEARARLGLAPADRVVLFVGTPRAHKGVLALVDAVAQIPDERIKLCVIGSVSDRDMKQRLDSLGDRVVLVGDRPLHELPENMMVGDLVCLLQDTESEITQYQMPAKFTDALAMGIPMLGTAVPPLREPISQGLIDSVEPGSLADQIVDSFDRLDERRAQAMKNRQRFLDTYSYEAIGERLQGLLDDLSRRPVPFAPDFEALLDYHRSHFRPPADGHDPTRRNGAVATNGAAATTPRVRPAASPEGSFGRGRRRWARGPSRGLEPTMDVVFFWKQNDSGIYGRRSDMMVKYLAASSRVGQIVHFDASMSERAFLRHRRRGEDPTDHGRLIIENVLRRARPGRRRGKVKEHVFLYRRADDPEQSELPEIARIGRLPTKDEYPDYVAGVLESYRVGRRPTLFWTCPVDYDFPQLARSLRPDLVVADVIDDYREFLGPDAPERVRATQNYRDVLAASDVVLTNCRPVQEAMEEYVETAHVIPNAAEPARNGLRRPRPRELRRLGGPVIGYVGNLSSRIDIDLLEEVARARPQWRLALLGSAHLSRSVLRLRELPNVHFLGVKPYSDVVHYVSAFDVAIVPHLDDPLTQSMNPLKVFVYASAGVPIVSTPVANMEEIRPLVRVASTAEAFIGEIEEALRQGRGLTPEARELITEHSWQRRVDQVLDLVDEKLGRLLVEA